MIDKAIITAKELTKTYHDAGRGLTVLDNVNLTINAGEQVAILGSSGSGKSTLLHLLAGLDNATHGEVVINNENVFTLNETQRSQLRNQKLGFVYQFHHLLPEFSALENVAMPLLLRKEKKKIAFEKAAQLLDKVGLSERKTHKPGQLSGGERQRVAIARALVNAPICVLADEPTGNLDQQTAEQVYQTMLDLNRTLKTSFIIVTHDKALAKHMDTCYELISGKIAAYTHHT